MDILTDSENWETRDTSFHLLPDEVHVWRTFLDVDKESMARFFRSLSENEKERADRMYHEKDRDRFIVSHGVLRALLGCYLGQDPKSILFSESVNHKPILALRPSQKDLTFNMSHSGAIGLYAISSGRAVGIDIEQIRNNVEIEQLATRFFSKNEINALMNLSNAKRLQLFFQFWTRKEAFVKSIGEGLSFPLESCDISSLSSDKLSPVLLEGADRRNFNIYGQDLDPGPGYQAAIAAEGENWSVSCQDFSLNLL